MSIYQQWVELAEKERSEKDHDKFWEGYLSEETKIYEYILENHKDILDGEFSELSEKFNVDLTFFAGFIDGINTSLKESIELEGLAKDSKIRLEVEFEKLYYNMLNAKAYWLYNLPQWEDILTEDKRREITRDYNKDNIAVSNKVGRNEPCTCGSGKKYKKCCGA
ncbi:MAG: SEC-C domain-containing protein [Clostridium sp.]|nr:SEC-C domain-containing protein [Clostridium sp.]